MQTTKIILAMLLSAAMALIASGCEKDSTPTLPPEYSSKIESLYSDVSTSEPTETEASESKKDETEAPETDVSAEAYSINIDISCEENLMFSRYDVCVYVDNTKLGVLEHGTQKIFSASLTGGVHTIRLTEEDDKSVDGSVDIVVDGNNTYKLEIACKNDQVKVESSTSVFPETSNPETEVPETEAPENESQTSTNYKIDYADTKSFEKALNEGVKVKNKIVQFTVIDYKPDSALGINCWAGEHLNFISKKELDVEKGSIVIGCITEEPTTVLGSWKIPYEVLSIDNESIETNTSNPSNSEKPSNTQPTEIALTMDDDDFKGMNFEEAEKIFREMGFTSFEYKTVDTENESYKDTICYIEITEWFLGNSNFAKGDKFDKDSTITFFSYKYEEPSPVFYSTNDYETAKKGNSGVFSYKNKSGSYDIYWIINFDEGYVYWFTEGNGELTCDKVKIVSGDLNDKITVTWHDNGDEWSWHLHFKYVNHPETLIVNDHYGIATEFRTTDLENALILRDAKRIKEY